MPSKGPRSPCFSAGTSIPAPRQVRSNFSWPACRNQGKKSLSTLESQQRCDTDSISAFTPLKEERYDLGFKARAWKAWKRCDFPHPKNALFEPQTCTRISAELRRCQSASGIPGPASIRPPPRQAQRLVLHRPGAALHTARTLGSHPLMAERPDAVF